jgi:hypothetical protein
MRFVFIAPGACHRHKSQRLAWRILRWVAAAVIVLMGLAAAVWFTVTREAVFCAVRSLAGARTELREFIQFEHIQAGFSRLRSAF